MNSLVPFTLKDAKKKFNKNKHDSARVINQHKSVVGFIARYNAGFVLGTYAKRIGFSSPLFGELWAIQHYLEWAKEQNYRDVIVEIDSKLATCIVNDSDSW